ncbi:MAG: zinc ribbon domain-containing protein [Methanobacteriaceae archaeon]|jgi:ribosomal protein L40E|nr:zinc ribbon domain-containing protein [Methanobacteriaceae archaeon]
MSLRRCFKCRSTVDDKYGFCTKCGAEFEGETIENQENICINCGFKNKFNAIRCVKCGVPLLKTSNNFDIFTYRKQNSKTLSNEPLTRTENILVILGYIFSLFITIIGFFISIYLLTRNKIILKKHGAIQLTIVIFSFTLVLLMYLNGDLNNITIENYTNLLNNYFKL